VTASPLGSVVLSVSVALLAASALASCCRIRCGTEGGQTLAVHTQNVEGCPVALLDGWRGDGCVKNHVSLGTPSAIPLGDVHWDRPCEPEWELVVFARGFAPTVVLPHSGSETRAQVASAGVSLRALDTVLVALWVVSSQDDSESAVDEAIGDADEANRVYSEFGAGLYLDYGGADSVRAHWIDSTSEYADSVGAWCSNDTIIRRHPVVTSVSAQVAATGRGLFDPRGLNVYNLSHVAYGLRGVNCRCLSTNAVPCDNEPRISFVARSGDIYGVLPHEIGHALGLVRPDSTWGHSDAIEGFGSYDGNLMYSGVTEVTNITLGQIYRMHFADDSWLNRGGEQRPGALFRSCGEVVLAPSPCPPINLRVPGGWR